MSRISLLQAGLGQTLRVLYVRLTHVFIIFCIVLVVVFLVPSAIFTIVETDWNFLDAFYYCFISMTTIGLGDYIPGDLPQQPYRPLYKIAAARTSSWDVHTYAALRVAALRL